MLENQEMKRTRRTQEQIAADNVLLSVSKPEQAVAAPTTPATFMPKAPNSNDYERQTSERQVSERPLSEAAIYEKAKKEGKLTEREIAYIKAKGMEQVRGIFHFWECKGGILKFDLMKFKGCKPDWQFVDGEMRTIPLYVAQHLNNSGFIEETKTIQDPITLQMRKIKQNRRRYSFESLEFLPPEVIGTSTEYEGLIQPDNSIIL